MSGATAQSQLLGPDPLAAAACATAGDIQPDISPVTEAEQYILEGRKLLARKRAKRAIQMFRKAVRLAPQFAPAWNDLGVAVYKSGQPRQAIQHFLNALDAEPTFSDATMNLVQIYQELQQPAQAIPYLQKLLELEPKNREIRQQLEKLTPYGEASAKAEALTHEGRTAVQQKKYKEALLAFIDATKAYPGCVPAWNDLGVTLYKINQPEAALEAFARALEINPSFVDSALNMASLHANQNEHAKGLAPLQRALAEDPENTEVRDALNKLNEEIKISNQIEACIFEGRAHMRKGAFDLAIRKYNEAIAIDADCYIAYNDLGVAYWSIQRPQQSIRYLKNALAVKPGFVDAAINLASIFAAVDRHNEAVHFLEEAAGIHPDNEELQKILEQFAPHNIVHHKIQTLVERGRDFVDANQMDQAIQCFIAATELDNNCAAAWSDLGVALAATDQVVTGIEAFERALRADPTFAEAALNLATVYANLERYDSGIAVLERVMKFCDDSPEVIELLNTLKDER